MAQNAYVVPQHPEKEVACAGVKTHCGFSVPMNVEKEKPTMAKKPTTSKKPMTKPRFYSMSFARVYPMYVKKAVSKGRTKAEVDEIILWLTGHTPKSLQKAMDAEMDIETFYAKARCASSRTRA